MRKKCVKAQIVENQALEQFLYAFTLMRKDLPTQARRPTWHDFCSQKPRFFNTFTLMRNMRNKMRKILENQRFEALRKALRKMSTFGIHRVAWLMVRT
jgi:hypothetical protein